MTMSKEELKQMSGSLLGYLAVNTSSRFAIILSETEELALYSTMLYVPSKRNSVQEVDGMGNILRESSGLSNLSYAILFDARKI